MRVGIDGLNLAVPHGTGIATYARTLSHAAAGLGHAVDVVYGADVPAGLPRAETDAAFFAALRSATRIVGPRWPSLARLAELARSLRGPRLADITPARAAIPDDILARLPAFDRILNRRDLFGRASRSFRDTGRFLPVRVGNPPEIMHWTYPVPARLVGSRNIYTVHDVIPLRLPTTTLDNKTYYFRLLTECLRTGDHIATVSEHSRRDILSLFPWLPAERIGNAYQTVMPPAGPGPEDAARLVRERFDLAPGGYFLFVGALEPKKNIGRLIEAHLLAATGLTLVMVGAPGWKSDRELALLAHQPANAGPIRRLDYVPAETLTALIRAARAVTLPSLYEGFGLPVVEAMALGTPVLTSRGGALQEIAGAAALLVDPGDLRDIAAGLATLARDDALCARLRAQGLARAITFDAAHYRERLSALYRRVLDQPSRRASAGPPGAPPRA